MKDKTEGKRSEPDEESTAPSSSVVGQIISLLGVDNEKRIEKIELVPSGFTVYERVPVSTKERPCTSTVSTFTKWSDFD